MTINELRTVLYDIFSEYFPNTQIVWSEQRELVKPSKDFITLKLRNYSRPKHLIKQFTNDVPIGYYAVKMRLEVQLFTHGGTQTITEDGEEYQVSVNTALNDLMDLTAYLTSEYADEIAAKYDIFIDAEEDAQDVSEVVDSNYEYRAFQEFTVAFTMTSEGLAGISRTNWEPTASGGGTKELADKVVEGIEPSSITIEENS